MMYTTRTTVVIKAGTYGLTLARYDWTGPRSEAGPGFWYAQVAGLTIWRDTTPPMTVGDRGAW